MSTYTKETALVVYTHTLKYIHNMSPHKHVIGCKSHDQTPMVYIAACYVPKTWRKPCKSWNAKALVPYGFLVMTTVGIWWPLSVYCMHSLPLGSHFGDNVWLLVCLLPPTMTWKTSKTLHPSPSPTLTNSWMTPKTSNQGGSIHLCRPESLVYSWCHHWHYWLCFLPSTITKASFALVVVPELHNLCWWLLQFLMQSWLLMVINRFTQPRVNNLLWLPLEGQTTALCTSKQTGKGSTCGKSITQNAPICSFQAVKYSLAASLPNTY